MINLKGYNFLFGKKAVSPVIGTILMVAVTVIMAAIVGGFVYQTARPKVPPAVSSSLADDSLYSVDAADSPNRIAKLTIEGGRNVAISELLALVTYTSDNSTGDLSVVLDGADWIDGDEVPMEFGVGGTAAKINLKWVDADGSGDISPGDRLDFWESAGTEGTMVKRASDFNVKLSHKASESFIADHTIRVY